MKAPAENKTNSDNKKRVERFGMEILNTWHGKRFCVVCFYQEFIKLPGDPGWTLVEDGKRYVTIPMFDYTEAGKKKCKETMYKFRSEAEEKANV